jgi:hypothetical protein
LTLVPVQRKGFINVWKMCSVSCFSFCSVIFAQLMPKVAEIPDSLLNTPLHVRYEILRVFLHTNTPLTGIPFPSANWQNYDSLWGFLRRLPALKGKIFPERISKEVWEACQNEFRHGSRGVLMVGSLRYSESTSAGPLFQFRLQSMRLERTYRLRRRFGNDRFLEIDIPYLSGQRVPKVLQDCPNGKSIVLEWLLEMHHIIGRFWQPFCTKEKDRSRQAVQQTDVDTGVAHRVFFFAVDGHGFANNCGIPKDTETVESRSPMSVGALLNWLRPTWENTKETALKLFARTPLGILHYLIYRSRLTDISTVKKYTNSSFEPVTNSSQRRLGMQRCNHD